MRKHAFPIALAVVTLGLVLGLTHLGAAPPATPPGTPMTIARYRLHMDSLGKFLLLDTASGQVWEYNVDNRPSPWKQIPIAPGLDGQRPPPAEKPLK